jgi:hypothetical protein
VRACLARGLATPLRWWTALRARGRSCVPLSWHVQTMLDVGSRGSCCHQPARTLCLPITACRTATDATCPGPGFRSCSGISASCRVLALCGMKRILVACALGVAYFAGRAILRRTAAAVCIDAGCRAANAGWAGCVCTSSALLVRRRLPPQPYHGTLTRGGADQ